MVDFIELNAISIITIMIAFSIILYLSAILFGFITRANNRKAQGIDK